MFKKWLGLPLAADGFCCAERSRRGLGLKPTSLVLLIAGAVLGFAAPGQAGAQTTTKEMPYEECLASKAEMQAQLAVQPERVFDIVSTGVVTITRLCTDEGSVLIGCSKRSNGMVISVLPSQSAVGCLWKSLVKTPT